MSNRKTAYCQICGKPNALWVPELGKGYVHQTCYAQLWKARAEALLPIVQIALQIDSGRRLYEITSDRMSQYDAVPRRDLDALREAIEVAVRAAALEG
jgi:hypothetical protein